MCRLRRAEVRGRDPRPLPGPAEPGTLAARGCQNRRLVPALSSQAKAISGVQAHSSSPLRAVPDLALPHRTPPPPKTAAAPEVTRPRPSILCPSIFKQHNLTSCSLSRTTLPLDRRTQQPTTGQNWPASRSSAAAASVGGARAASKFSGATADVSQQRSREASGPRRLAVLVGRGGGVTAAAWGSLCDTITTTLCWCRGSLCLQQIPPVPPAPCTPAVPAVPARGSPPPAPAM